MNKPGAVRGCDCRQRGQVVRARDCDQHGLGSKSLVLPFCCVLGKKLYDTFPRLVVLMSNFKF